MRNLPFVIWMIGFPISNSIGDYVHKYLLENTYSNNVELIAAIICLTIWIWIGICLYEKE